MLAITAQSCGHHELVTLPQDATDLEASIIEARESNIPCSDCNADITEEIFAEVESIWKSNTQ